MIAASLRHWLSRPGWNVAAIAWLCIPFPAQASVRIQVLETDPFSPATLGSWQRFNVRFGYVTDEPIRVHGEAFSGGRKVTSATSGSPVYPIGSGDGMFWFAYTDAAQVDRLVLTAYPAKARTALTETALDVELRWTGVQGAPSTPADWVRRMDAAAEQRHKEQYEAYMNQPTPAWQSGLFLALVWSPVAYLVTQVMMLRRFRGGWRLAALVPLLPMGLVLVYTVAAFRAGSNLFPLVLIFTSPVALVYLVALLAVRRYRSSARS